MARRRRRRTSTTHNVYVSNPQSHTYHRGHHRDHNNTKSHSPVAIFSILKYIFIFIISSIIISYKITVNKYNYEKFVDPDMGSKFEYLINNYFMNSVLPEGIYYFKDPVIVERSVNKELYDVCMKLKYMSLLKNLLFIFIIPLIYYVSLNYINKPSTTKKYIHKQAKYRRNLVPVGLFILFVIFVFSFTL